MSAILIPPAHFVMVGDDMVTIHGQSDPAPCPLTRKTIVSEIERVTALGWAGTAARYQAMLAFYDAHAKEPAR